MNRTVSTRKHPSRRQTLRRAATVQQLAAREMMAGDTTVPMPLPVSPLPWVEIFTVENQSGQSEADPKAENNLPAVAKDAAIKEMFDDTDLLEEIAFGSDNSKPPVSYLKTDLTDTISGYNRGLLGTDFSSSSGDDISESIADGFVRIEHRYDPQPPASGQSDGIDLGELKFSEFDGYGDSWDDGAGTSSKSLMTDGQK